MKRLWRRVGPERGPLSRRFSWRFPNSSSGGICRRSQIRPGSPASRGFYRKRLFYRLTSGGEAVEAGLRVFVTTLARSGEIQSVALEDIRARLIALAELAREAPMDAAKIHAALRDLVQVFEGLAANAELSAYTEPAVGAAF